MRSCRSKWGALAAGLAILLFTAGCGGGGEEGGTSPDAVATAAGHELTIAEASRILSSGDELASWREAARELANLWVDYTLLATAAAEDSTMAHLDVSPIVEERVQQVVVTALRDSVLGADTTISDRSERSPEVAAAASTFVAGLEDEASLEIGDGAVEIVRQLARDPGMELSGGATARPLVEYDGGSLTVEEVRQFLQSRPPPFRRQVAAEASDEDIENVILRLLTRRELLVAEAERQGWYVLDEDREPIAEDARELVRETARGLGLLSVQPESGESRRAAVDRAVRDLLEAVVRNERDATNLGAITYVLRQQYPYEIHQSAIDRVVSRMVETR